LDDDLPLIRVLLRLVHHVPAKRGPEAVNEIAAHVRLGIFGREVIRLVRLKVADEVFDLREGFVEGVGNHEAVTIARSEPPAVAGGWFSRPYPPATAGGSDLSFRAGLEGGVEG